MSSYSESVDEHIGDDVVDLVGLLPLEEDPAQLLKIETSVKKWKSHIFFLSPPEP